MYFGDAYFSRFVLQKTPYTVQLHPYPRLDFMLYRPKPYWYSLESQNAVMGGFVPQFRFPLCYDSHQYSEWRQSYFLNVRNPGALPVPFTREAPLLGYRGQPSHPQQHHWGAHRL